jgi:hypothetical protein
MFMVFFISTVSFAGYKSRVKGCGVLIDFYGLLDVFTDEMNLHAGKAGSPPVHALRARPCGSPALPADATACVLPARRTARTRPTPLRWGKPFSARSAKTRAVAVIVSTEYFIGAFDNINAPGVSDMIAIVKTEPENTDILHSVFTGKIFKIEPVSL